MPKGKRMRLPNGFGQISEIHNSRLRKPFRAMVTVGKTETGRPICKLLKPEAYFRTYNEAYSALMKYHENPYDFGGDVTVKEIFDRWYARHYSEEKGMSYVGKMQTARAWKYCKSVENIPIRELRVKHIKYCMDHGVANINGVDKTPDVYNQKTIKSIFNQLFDYAIEYDLVEVNLARNFKLSKDVIGPQEDSRREHIPYTEDEINIIKQHEGELVADFILIQCYSGWRPQELVSMPIENISLENRTFTGGMKTEAGKNRVVPIHPAIENIIRRRVDQAKMDGSSFLFYKIKNKTASQISYRYIERYYTSFLGTANLSNAHRPHDGRKHFVTMAKKYKVDEYAIKYMVGHAIKDITEQIYTQRDLDWLREEIEKIK